MILITGLDEIISVWANDAHVLSVFVSLLFLPFLIYFNFYLFKNASSKMIFDNKETGFFKKFNVEVFFALVIVSLLSGFSGIGQLGIDHLGDCAVRAAGFFILACAVSLFAFLIFLFKDDRSCFFYYLSRHPKYFLMIVIAAAISMIMMNVISAVLTVLLNLIILIRIRYEEKLLIKADENYIDYITQVPALIPNVTNAVRKYKTDIINR